MVELKSILKKSSKSASNVNLNLDKKSIRFEDATVHVFGENLPLKGKIMSTTDFEKLKETEGFGKSARRPQVQSYNYEDEEFEDEVSVKEFYYQTDSKSKNNNSKKIEIFTLSINSEIINMEVNDISVSKGGVIPLSRYDMNYINYREIIHDPKTLTEDTNASLNVIKKHRQQRSVKIDEMAKEESIEDKSNIDFKIAKLSNYAMPYVEIEEEEEDDEEEDEEEEGFEFEKGKKVVSIKEHNKNKRAKLNDSTSQKKTVNLKENTPLIVKPSGKFNEKLLKPNRGGLEAVKIPRVIIDY
ncbi:hypothetical protein QEN19_001956 [Hanseniaspora menglaensis]